MTRWTTIELASRDVIAGYTGAQQRATCSCIGDAVNPAARQGRTATLALGPVPLNGKAAATATFALHLAA